MALDWALDEITTALGPDMVAWRWGALHRATFTHRVLTHVPVIASLADLSIESDGGDHTVNRGTTRPPLLGGCGLIGPSYLRSTV